MRKTFFNKLTEYAKEDESIWLLTADMICHGAEGFPKERFINCGVAEQNMIGIATGLALCGKIPYCYSISTFLIFRAYEFIRNDIAYQNLPVRLVGCCGPYPDYGISHNCEDDVETILHLPHFLVANPKSKNELLDYMKLFRNELSPIYFRLKRGN